MGFGIRMGRVISVNYPANTVDVFLDSGGGIIYGAMMLSSFNSTNTGYVELPIIKSVQGANGPGQIVPLATPDAPSTNSNLFQLENAVRGKVDLDDPTTNYVYAIVALYNESTGKSNAVCLGFVYPFRTQMLFDINNIDPALPQYVQDEIKKLAGGYIHRTNSDVYTVVDIDGNMEWTHPNGSFFRIAERPTIEEDGAIHVDLSGGNRKAINSDGSKNPNMAWNTSRKTGKDGNANSSRKLYAHLEVATQQGIVSIDVNKKTGNITILTPKDSSNATQSVNQLTIISGGDAILQSVAGNVTIQSVKQDINVESYNTVTVKTDTAKESSILLAPNSSRKDHLLLFQKVAEKFNKHKHTCGDCTTSPPDQQITKDDATFVTTAG
jgi:hypothetical protein